MGPGQRCCRTAQPNPCALTAMLDERYRRQGYERMTERSDVWITYDDRYIYVAVLCFDRASAEISRGLGRRDDNLPTDNLAIGFDPRHDHLTGYVFQVNPSGVQAMVDGEPHGVTPLTVPDV